MDAIAGKKVTYDLSRFDRSYVAKEQVEKDRVVHKSKQNTRSRTSIGGFAVFSAISVFAVLIALLFSYVNLTEASDLNRRSKDRLATLQEENQMLEVNLNQRMGAMQVRDYAVTRLGMSKIDKSQITYVTTSGGDRFEVVEEKRETQSRLITGLIKGFSTVVEYMN